MNMSLKDNSWIKVTSEQVNSKLDEEQCMYVCIIYMLKISPLCFLGMPSGLFYLGSLILKL